jgi:hypothetical protein
MMDDVLDCTLGVRGGRLSPVSDNNKETGNEGMGIQGLWDELAPAAEKIGTPLH